MDVLINELSISCQATDPGHATVLMLQLKDVLETIAPMIGEGKRYIRGGVFPFQILCHGMTVREWINRAFISKDLRLFYLYVMKNSVDIEAYLFDDAPDHVCRFNGNNVSFSSVAGGAHLGGVLACLDQCLEFSKDSIRVEYSPDTSPVIEKIVATIFSMRQIWGVYRPRYVPSPKHSLGGQGTLMDLDDTVAQEVLDNGVGAGKRIYGFRNGKYYEFQNDNAGGYHGYPVNEVELPVSVKQKLRVRGIIQ